ncbi:MAG: DNA-3-methyladenine glycosylase I [Acidimicrobiia bacterium]
MQRTTEPNRSRCTWAGSDPLMVAYHDKEWGLPVHDDRTHFEFLVLEGAQAGLSWSTILNKREGYRRSFADFDAAKVARYSPAKIEKLLTDPSIVRNRAKVAATVSNAKAFLDLQKDEGSFNAYLWGLAGGKPIVRRRRSMSDIPATSPLSHKLSTDLKERGFRFVGPTVMYAHLQAVGVVNDHVVSCFRWSEVQG